AAADPLSSRAALSLLKALSAAGDRAGALQHAARHERLIRDELEIESDAVVSDFVASLRSQAQIEAAQRTPPAQRGKPDTALPAPATDEPVRVLEHTN